VFAKNKGDATLYSIVWMWRISGGLLTGDDGG